VGRHNESGKGCVAAVCDLEIVNADGLARTSAPTRNKMSRTCSVVEDGSAIGAHRTNHIGGSAASAMRRDEERGERPSCRRLPGTECTAALWTEPQGSRERPWRPFVAAIAETTRQNAKRTYLVMRCTLVRSAERGWRNVNPRLPAIAVLFTILRLFCP
jgi:hypothetical protein